MTPNSPRLPTSGAMALIAAFFSSSIALCEPLAGKSVEQLKLVSTRSCYFAEDEAEFQLAATGENADQPTIDWRLVASNRTLHRGSVIASPTGQARGVSIMKFEVRLPPLEPGNVVSLSLEFRQSHARREVSLVHPIYVFSRDPFAGQYSWLEDAQIKLLDFEGPTADLFDKEGFPHTRLIDLGAIDRLDEGILFVGEGVSFREHRMLAETLWQAARRGVTVVCLAPTAGDFPLQLQETADSLPPTQFILARENRLRKFDKRFDPIAGVSLLSLVPARDQVVIRADASQGEWTWLSIELPPDASRTTTGRLIVCTWGIVSQWEETPVHRFLLARILQDFTSNASSEEDYEHITNRQ